jgi:hypothetical protein
LVSCPRNSPVIPGFSKDFPSLSNDIPNFSKEIPNLFVGRFQRKQGVGGDGGRFPASCILSARVRRAGTAVRSCSRSARMIFFRVARIPFFRNTMLPRTLPRSTSRRSPVKTRDRSAAAAEPGSAGSAVDLMEASFFPRPKGCRGAKPAFGGEPRGAPLTALRPRNFCRP